MALFYEWDSGAGSYTFAGFWSIGDPMPKFSQEIQLAVGSAVYNARSIRFQADGHELELLLNALRRCSGSGNRGRKPHG